MSYLPFVLNPKNIKEIKKILSSFLFYTFDRVPLCFHIPSATFLFYTFDLRACRLGLLLENACVLITCYNRNLKKKKILTYWDERKRTNKKNNK